MQTKFESNKDKIKDMTPEEKTQFKNHRAELEKWEKDNGIDMNYLMGGVRRGMERGFHGFEKQ